MLTKKVLYCMGEMSAVTNEWHRWTRLVESFQSVQRSSKMVSCIKTYEHFMIYALSEWLLRTIENPGRTSSQIVRILTNKKPWILPSTLVSGYLAVQGGHDT